MVPLETSLDASREDANLREVLLNSTGMNLIVPLTINGTAVNAVTDTGAQISVISKTLAEKLGLPVDNSETIKLKNAQKDRSMYGKITKGLKITLGKHKFQWDTVIADIHDEFILGYDFLAKHCSSINPMENSITIDGDIIPGKIKRDDNGKEYFISRVTLEKRVVVPPNTRVLARARMSHPAPVDYVIHPGQDPRLKGLLMPCVLVKGSPEVKICLLNDGDSFKTIKAGCPLGTAIEAEQEVDVADSLDTELPEDDSTGGTAQNQGPVPIPDPSITPACSIRTMEQSKMPEHLQDMYNDACQRLTPDQSQQLADLLIEFADVFAKNDLDLGTFTAIEHRINTGDAAPIQMRMRRTPLGFQQEEEKHLNAMLDAGVIEPSESEWASSPVLIRKKDRSLRYCLDFRKLNSVTVKDRYPLPLIEECLDALNGVKFMSCLDLAAGYWQINIRKEDRHKTAFLTKYGLFQNIKMPFGLANAPATFQRAMNLVLRGMTWKEVLAYLDDLIVLARSFQEGLRNLRRVFERFRKYNLKFKPRKCHLFKTEVEVLGKVVGEEGLSIQKSKVQDVLSWPVPTCRRDVQKFLGFINYHREFLQNLAKRAGCLYHLAKPSTVFKWEPVHQDAFDDLKHAMVSAPVLALPNSEDHFILDCDASNTAIGAELLQVQDGVERTIAYSSHVLTAEMRRYCTTRKELLAVVVFTRQYRHYLLGRPFTVRTDHNSLTWLMGFKYIQGQLARWIEELAQYDMTIVHRSGEKHTNADALSRIPEEEPQCVWYRAHIPLDCLPCGGCTYCTQTHKKWSRFEEDVDDVIPLVVREITLSYSDEEEDGIEDPDPLDAQRSQDQPFSSTPAHNSSSDNDVTLSDELHETADQDSTQPDTRWLNGYSPEELRSFQLKDPDLAPLINWLEGESPPLAQLYLQSKNTKRMWLSKDQLQLKDGVLYYKWENVTSSYLKLVVPDELRNTILLQIHDSKTGGHPGQRNTIDRCKQSFYWPELKRDCILFVRSCHKCNKNKKPSRRQKGPLVRYHSGTPFDRVHIDLLGPFMRSEAGNRYVLVMIDQFTKWIETHPLSDQSAEQVAKSFIENFVVRFGTPSFVHSDRGANFESSLFQTICTLFEIIKTRTTAYRPCSNGQVERPNRTILQTTRCLIDKEKKKWDEYLPYIAMAMRATINRSTGFTPNMMVFGREISLPVDVLMGTTNKEGDKEPPEYVSNLVSKLKTTHAIARENLEKTQVYMKDTYDAKLKQQSYEVGDLVYKLNTAVKKGQSRKLEQIYVGPFIVSKVLSPVLYEIQGRRKSGVAHHDRLKPCDDRYIPLWVRRKRHGILDLDVTIGYDAQEEEPSSPARARPPRQAETNRVPESETQLDTSNLQGEQSGVAETAENSVDDIEQQESRPAPEIAPPANNSVSDNTQDVRAKPRIVIRSKNPADKPTVILLNPPGRLHADKQVVSDDTPNPTDLDATLPFSQSCQVNDSEEEPVAVPPESPVAKRTRAGRKVKLPTRFTNH